MGMTVTEDGVVRDATKMESILLHKLEKSEEMRNAAVQDLKVAIERITQLESIFAASMEKLNELEGRGENDVTEFTAKDGRRYVSVHSDPEDTCKGCAFHDSYDKFSEDCIDSPLCDGFSRQDRKPIHWVLVPGEVSDGSNG